MDEHIDSIYDNAMHAESVNEKIALLAVVFSIHIFHQFLSYLNVDRIKNRIHVEMVGAWMYPYAESVERKILMVENSNSRLQTTTKMVAFPKQWLKRKFTYGIGLSPVFVP